jgi:sRNA-binding regulator protein Hfq
MSMGENDNAGAAQASEPHVDGLKEPPFRLTPAESRMVEAAAVGEIAEYGISGTSSASDKEGSWGDELRAEVIRALLLETYSKWRVDASGVRVSGARIRGRLDLTHARVKFPLSLHNCLIEEAPSFQQCKLTHLDLSGTHLPGLEARGCAVDHDMILVRVVCRGPTTLDLAKINGMLDCTQGAFASDDKSALSAKAATVNGPVLLRDGFTARGEVVFMRAQIGSLECRDATLINPGAVALRASGAIVAGPVFLGKGLKAQGEVNLQDAHLGGLECNDGIFTNPNGTALRLERATITRPVILRNGFKAQGQVNLRDAQIGGLEFNGTVTSDDPKQAALVLERATVAGPVFLRNGFKAQGEVNLRGAQIGGVLDCQGGAFTNPSGTALLAQRASVRAVVFLRNGFTAQGEVDLRDAQLGGLECNDSIFTNPNGTALILERATVAAPVFLRNGFKAQGEVNLRGAQIGGVLDCQGGAFTNPSGDALLAERMTVSGPVRLSVGRNAQGRPVEFVAEGGVNLREAQIAGALNCEGGIFKGADDPLRPALAAEGAMISGPVLLRRGFTARGQVNLLRAHARTLECGGGTFTSEGQPALLAAEMTISGPVLLHGIHGTFTSRGEVTLFGARIGGGLDCRGAMFLNRGGRAFNGRGMNVDGSFAFRELARRPQGIVDLTDARVATLDDDAESWPEPGTLRIRGFVYTSLSKEAPRTARERIPWLQLPGAEEFSPHPYEQLVKVLRVSGDDREARDVAIRKQVDLRRWGGLSRTGRLGNWLLGLIGHGYKPGRAAIILLILYVMSVIVFAQASADGVMVSTRDVQQPATTTSTATTTTTIITNTSNTTAAAPTTTVLGARQLNARSPCSNRYPCFSPWAYSFDVLVPLVKLQQSDSWRPDASTSKGQWYRRYGYLMTILGWAFATLAAAGFSGLLRKD